MTQQLHPESSSPDVITEQEPDRLMRQNIAYYEGASYIYKHHLNAWTPRQDPAAVQAFPPAAPAQCFRPDMPKDSLPGCLQKRHS